MRLIIDADARQNYSVETVNTASNTVLDRNQNKIIDADAVQAAAAARYSARMRNLRAHCKPVMEI